MQLIRDRRFYSFINFIAHFPHDITSFICHFTLTYCRDMAKFSELRAFGSLVLSWAINRLVISFVSIGAHLPSFSWLVMNFLCRCMSCAWLLHILYTANHSLNSLTSFVLCLVNLLVGDTACNLFHYRSISILNVIFVIWCVYSRFHRYLLSCRDLVMDFSTIYLQLKLFLQLPF